MGQIVGPICHQNAFIQSQAASLSELENYSEP